MKDKRLNSASDEGLRIKDERLNSADSETSETNVISPSSCVLHPSSKESLLSCVLNPFSKRHSESKMDEKKDFLKKTQEPLLMLP